jgi:2-(1,2-epoxy-1,2-dihydrophenyl)acetyl-CoA isomerase
MTRTLDTGTDVFLGHVDDGVAVLTFNRPDRRNALHPDIYRALSRLLPELARDDDVGAIVLTGAGGAFCAGGDVRGMNERNEGTGSAPPMSFEQRVEDLRHREDQVSLALWEYPKVTIAAIPGACAGAGLSIALACDLRIAAESAVFTTAFAKVGFSGDFGGSWFLTQLIGAGKARELYLTAERFDGAEAARLGIVNRAVPDDALQDEAMAWARRFAAGPLVAQRYIKENMNRAVTSDLRTALAGEATNMTRSGMTDDHKEAVKAFLEKREPKFTGR